MKRIWLFAVVALFAISDVAQAAETPEFVSATFQEILSRVSQRDKESGAILRVKAKEDAMRGWFLNFSISELPYYGGQAIVVLRVNSKATDGVYEKYRLKIDGAMRQELNSQKRRADLERARAIEALEQIKKNIAELSGGTLSYGMTLSQVIEIKGEPEKIEPVIYRGAMFRMPTFTAIYPDIRIRFEGSVDRNTTLIAIKLAPK